MVRHADVDIACHSNSKKRQRVSSRLQFTVQSLASENQLRPQLTEAQSLLQCLVSNACPSSTDGKALYGCEDAPGQGDEREAVCEHQVRCKRRADPRLLLHLLQNVQVWTVILRI